ncbi:MAG TPA: hypothetical protein VIK65_02780 [Candidatus Limnocylindrales bacterium]|jgi:hypothetical protein
MRAPSTTQPFICVTCEAEIVGRPTFHVGLPFCCAGCAADGPCICSYDEVAVAEPRVRHCHDLGELRDLVPLEPVA